MSITALDLIKGALRPLNVLTGNTSLTDSEANDALQALNWMLESWANETLTVYATTRETFTLTAGLNPHTMGTGGNLNTVRPTRLLAVTVTISGVDYPVEILGYDDWEAIRLKTLQTAWPQYLYFQPEYPLAKLYTWPVNSGNTINIGSEKPLTGFASLYDTVSLPPGYADAIRYNLAMRLAPEYQITAGADIAMLAEKAIRNIKRTNGNTPPTTATDPALRSSNYGAGYIVYTDGYR